jgi:AcrR family transcriptional regulator
MLSLRKAPTVIPHRTLADDARDTAKAMGPQVRDVMTSIRANARRDAADRTRRDILVAAKAAFDALGFNGTGLRAIAQDAGVSTGAIFNNWPDKVALYTEVYGHPPVSPEEGAELLRRCAELEQRLADAA